tara:strand:- start:1109 stop:1552 length:444 start_codon:yes stop_codon:yes gene_type:complete
MTDEKIDGKYGVKEPNAGTDGKVASNMTGEAIDSVFDYGDVSDEQKEAVLEIIGLCENEFKDVPCGMFAEELKRRFETTPIPMKDYKKSVWGKLTEDERIGMSIQGFRNAKDENGKPIRIPHIGFSADLDYLDGFVNRLVKKAQEIK